MGLFFAVTANDTSRAGITVPTRKRYTEQFTDQFSQKQNQSERYFQRVIYFQFVIPAKHASE